MKWLEDRADQFTHILTDIAADDDGIVRTAIHYAEMRPLEDSDVPEDIWKPGQASSVGYYCYEDSGMTTGSFLASQSLRYQGTGDASAKRNADATFDGVRYVYNLGKEKEEGYFPKPYGKKNSDQISRDQYLFVLNGLSSYYRIADHPTRQEIEQMITKMVEYWIGINYSPPYFNLPPSSAFDDFMGSLFLGIVRIPYEHTGDEKFRKEYDRLLSEEHLGSKMSETLRAMFLRGEKYDDATYFRQQEHCMMMKIMAVDYLWDADAGHRDLWAKSLQAFWSDDVLVALDREDGLNYWIVGFDPENNETFLTEPGEIKELRNLLNAPIMTWGGLRKEAGSTQTAYNAVVIGSRLQMKEAVDTAKLILQKMDLGKFRGYTIPDERHLPPSHLWETGVLYTGYVSFWLWAYWLGRARGLW